MSECFFLRHVLYICGPRSLSGGALLNIQRVRCRHKWSSRSPKRCKIGGKLVLITNGCRIWAFDWYQNGWPSITLNGVIITEFGNFRGILRKSGWQSHNYEQFTITMSSSKRLQRDRATPTVKIPIRFINLRLNAQYLLSYRFDKKSYNILWAFDWYQYRWPWITLNGEITLSLRYFTEFGTCPYFALFHRIGVRCRRKTIVRLTSVSKSILLIVYDHINTICAIIQRLFR